MICHINDIMPRPFYFYFLPPFQIEYECSPGSQEPHRNWSIKSWTPLHIASDAENAEICSLLLDAGAVLDREDNDQKTPLDLAKRRSMSRWSGLENPIIRGKNPYIRTWKIRIDNCEIRKLHVSPTQIFEFFPKPRVSETQAILEGAMKKKCGLL